MPFASNTLSPDPSEAVKVQRLDVMRGGSKVLDGLDFAIPASTITGLLGPSGSGKTTLMRTIVGVHKPSRGTVQVLGKPAGHPDLRRRVGYVTQAASVYPDLSVEANIRYFGAMHGRKRADTAEAIAAVGLEKQARQKAGSLSGGQLNRASLACALVSKPSLLVMDEPTVGLDPVLRAELWHRFHAMADDGTTILVSSHVMEEAAHCASLLLLREGRLLAHMSPAELSRRGNSADLDRAFLNFILEPTPPESPSAASAEGAPS